LLAILLPVGTKSQKLRIIIHGVSFVYFKQGILHPGLQLEMRDQKMPETTCPGYASEEQEFISYTAVTSDLIQLSELCYCASCIFKQFKKLRLSANLDITQTVFRYKSA
jgi:hypothetical protein